MLTAINTKQKIKEYILKTTLADVKEIDDDLQIFDSGLLDSMGLLFLIEFLKEEFSLSVKDEELIPDNFSTVNTIIEFIETKA